MIKAKLTERYLEVDDLTPCLRFELCLSVDTF
jgi:hypothetical protein